MWRAFQRLDRAALLLLLGLFLLWNWRFASVTAHNHPYLIPSDVLQLFAWKTLAFIGVLSGLFLVTRSVQRTLIGVTFCVIMWLFGGALVSAVVSADVLKVVFYSVLIVGVAVLAGYMIKAYPKPSGSLVAVYGAVLCGLQAPGVFAALTTSTVQDPLKGFETSLPLDLNEPLPHIIYVVPDRYASNAVLRSQYGFSNEGFTEELSALGFHIWDNQYANYPKTFQSLASTLNSDYLDPVLEGVGEKRTSYSYLTPLIQDFAARRALQERGYSYKHIGSWWEPTRLNSWANETFADVTLPHAEITRAYFEVTPLKGLLAQAEAKRTPCEIVDEKLSFIRHSIESETPQFILWHTLMTHDPYIFNDDGSCRDLDEDRHFVNVYDDRKTEYIKHVEHFNRIMLELITSVFRESERDVIFVIQSDEGPFPKDLVRAVYGTDQEPYNYWQASQTDKRQKHGIFNAIYLPSQAYDEAIGLRSPVNNFRLIFRELTGQDIPLLPDRFYSFEFDHHPYNLRDISDELSVPNLSVATLDE